MTTFNLSIDIEEFDAAEIVESLSDDLTSEQFKELIVAMFECLTEEQQFEAIEEMLDEETKTALAQQWLDTEEE